MYRLFILLMMFHFFAGASEQKSISLDLVHDEFKSPKQITKQILTPLYKKTGNYEGFDLIELLKLNKFDLKKSELIVFEASDDYKMAIPVSDILKYQPFLAKRDASLPKGTDWTLVRDEGRQINPGPYYLLWNAHVPSEYWAFNVVEISSSSFSDFYGASMPKKGITDPKILHGFKIFQSACSACHSVNLVGGNLGPELNVPQNIFEYLSPNFIENYVISPSSFRANAKMPPQTELTKNDRTAILDYLRSIQNEKVCINIESCEKILKIENMK